MGFRITTNMMMNTYRYNLMNSTNNLADARDQVLTQRTFNSYAEDPAAATQAFRLRRDWYQTQNQITNTKDVYSKFNTAWQNIQGMLKDLINPMDKVSVIRGNSDTAGESRTALAQVLRESAESMIQGFNQQLGDQFIFSGNDGLNAPFTWDGETLLYRGIDVTSGGVQKPTAAEPTWLDDWETNINLVLSGPDIDDPANAAIKDEYERALAWCKYYKGEMDEKPDDTTPVDAYIKALAAQDGDISATEAEGWISYYTRETDIKPTADEPAWATSGTPATDKYGVPTDMPAASSDPVEQGWIDYYTDQGNLAKLQEMSEEEMYIDLGMGAKENSPNDPIKGTYFNSALSGLNFTGFGVDEDGDPKNFAILLRELADVFDNWNENGQKYVPDEYQNLSESELKQLMKDDPAVAKEINEFHEAAQAKAMRLMDKLKLAQEDLTAANVELDARSAYLLTNQSRLETQGTELNVEILDVEQVDLAEAITNFSWDYYCYSAALKIGNQLLSQSLIDYMS